MSFKKVLFPSPWWKHIMGCFSDIYCQKLVRLLEVKLTKVGLSPHLLMTESLKIVPRPNYNLCMWKLPCTNEPFLDTIRVWEFNSILTLLPRNRIRFHKSKAPSHTTTLHFRHQPHVLLSTGWRPEVRTSLPNVSSSLQEAVFYRRLFCLVALAKLYLNKPLHQMPPCLSNLQPKCTFQVFWSHSAFPNLLILALD